LARLGSRYRVALHTGVFGDDYRRLMTQARVVVNRSRHGECNRRALEAAAAGALLFQEADNRQVASLFRDGRECVFYRDSDLETLLAYYLGREDDRRRIAAAARELAGRLTFTETWG